MKNVLIAAVVIVVLGLGYYFYSNSSGSGLPQTTNVPSAVQTPPTEMAVPTSTGSATAKTVIVRYTASGFSPSSVTIAKGDTVSFVADSGSDEMWVASNPHPTHEGYDGTTKNQHCAADYTGPTPFDQCSKGTSYSFTFEKVGTWGYHNHGNYSDTGTVVVQ